MAQSRYYSANAQPTVLTASITPTTTVVNVQQTVGFPATTPFILALDYNSPSEEIVLATAVAGTNITVTRGYDGTSATSHNAGAAVRHTWTAMDGNDSRAHEGSTSGVHGVTGNVVGTTDSQTLSNKTLNSPVFTGTVNLASPNITGTVTGGASYTAPTITNPTITGTVGGGASYTSPTITGTVAGGATYAAHQDNDLTVRNSAVGNVPLTVNGIAGTSVMLADIQLNGSSRFQVTTNGQAFANSASAATTPLRVNIPTGPSVDVAQFQINAVNQVRVSSAGALVANNALSAGGAAFNVDSSGNLTGATNMTMGAWTSFTPTWTGSVTNPTIGNGTLISRWARIGRIIHWTGTLTFGTTTNGGTGVYAMSLPVQAASNNFTVGSCNYVNVGDNEYLGVVEIPSGATTASFQVKTSTNAQSSGTVSNTVPVAANQNSRIFWNVTYEAAT